MIVEWTRVVAAKSMESDGFRRCWGSGIDRTGLKLFWVRRICHGWLLSLWLLQLNGEWRALEERVDWKTDKFEAEEHKLSPECVPTELPLDIKVEISSWQLNIKYGAKKTDLGKWYTFVNFWPMYVNWSHRHDRDYVRKKEWEKRKRPNAQPEGNPTFNA